MTSLMTSFRCYWWWW